MQESYQTAQDTLLAPAGLDAGQLDHVLNRLRARGLDYGDLYFESSQSESWAGRRAASG